MNIPDSFVIAVSGPSGAGKTTLAANLAAALAPSTQLSYDHYYRSVAAWECDYRQWVEQGCDPNQFNSIPPLVDDLRALRHGHTVTSPRNEVIPAAPIIIIEEPWGRQRAELAPLIDYVVHIDIPLDVSLARRLFRDGQRGYDLFAYVRAYLEMPLRSIYLQMQKGAASADLVLDGLLPEGDIVMAAVKHIRGVMAHR